MHRYTDKELESLLDDLESDISERKESFSDDVKKRAREAICAFANDLPNHNKLGVLFIGARDDGTSSGLKVDEQLLITLADMKTDGKILPLPSMTVEKRTLNGAEMAVVTVKPSDMPPVKYDGRIWVRTASRRGIASAQDERILNEKLRHNVTSYDIYPVPSASIDDLSRVLFEYEYLPAAFAKDILAANDRSYEQRLAACKMIVSVENTTPTMLGLLSVGKDPQYFIPGACIQFLRIDGTELADLVIDEERIGGAMKAMIKQAEVRMNAHVRTAYDIVSKPTHIITKNYPESALQQILYNAVMHRSYEEANTPIMVYWFNDRIEINSQGGTYGDVTADNFGKTGAIGHRNPNIATVMKNYGFVQAFGRGINTARRTMLENGNPEPEFNVSPGRVICTLRAKASAPTE